MGQFVVAFCFIIVILQATSLLLERPASTWSFWLVSAFPNTLTYLQTTGTNNTTTGAAGYVWKGVDIMFKTPTPPPTTTFNQLNGLSVWWSAPSAQQIACLTTRPTTALQLPIHCILRAHSTQFINPALRPWNPHIILLTLCCIQLVICISKTQHSREQKQDMGSIPKDRNLHVPLGYALGLLTLLIMIILILTGLNNSSLVEYTTILTITVLLLWCAWYCWDFNEFADNGDWSLNMHMQLVSVPLAVLSIATMGARLWTDVLTHHVLLSAATNCLWLQNNLAYPWAAQLSRIATILLPSVSLGLAHMQWGSTDDWKYAVALMGCAGLLPLFIFTILVNSSEKATSRNDKIRLRMAHLCTAAALLSLVVNLAVFNTSDAKNNDSRI